MVGDGAARLLKTLLLGALVPEVESLKGLTAQRLAALNHGTFRSPIPGREAQDVLRKCRDWASEIGGAGGAAAGVACNHEVIEETDCRCGIVRNFCDAVFLANANALLVRLAHGVLGEFFAPALGALFYIGLNVTMVAPPNLVAGKARILTGRPHPALIIIRMSRPVTVPLPGIGIVDIRGCE